jgi:hypothetical protein
MVLLLSGYRVERQGNAAIHLLAITIMTKEMIQNEIEWFKVYLFPVILAVCLLKYAHLSSAIQGI